jgi:hypothetical protein
MNQEEEFSNEIKDKLDSRTFECSEASWEKANALIQDAQKKKKRRFFFYLFSAGAVFIGSIVCLQYPLGKTKNVISQKDTHEAISKQNLNSSEEETQILNSGNRIKNENLETVSTTENPVTETTSVNLKNKKENSTLNNGNSTFSIKNVNNSKMAAAKNNLTPKTAKQEKTKDTVALKTTVKPEKKQENFESEPTQDVVSNTNINDHENGTVAVDTKNNNKDSAVKELLIEDVNISTSAKDSSVLNEPINTLIADGKKDTTKKEIDRLQVFGFAGAAFTPGYVKNIQIKESFNPSAGIFIRKTLKPNFGIGIGLFYTIYGNITESSKVFNNTTQDFGYKNETTEIRQSHLHYLKLPIVLDYNKGKNIFSIGAQFMYLVTGSSTVTTYKESYGLQADYSSKKGYGYTNGFLPYDVSVVAGYRRQINRKISVQLLVDFGFMDIKNNTYFNSKAFDRNKSIQLNLGYKLFSK